MPHNNDLTRLGSAAAARHAPNSPPPRDRRRHPRASRRRTRTVPRAERATSRGPQSDRRRPGALEQPRHVHQVAIPSRTPLRGRSSHRRPRHLARLGHRQTDHSGPSRRGSHNTARSRHRPPRRRHPPTRRRHPPLGRRAGHTTHTLRRSNSTEQSERGSRSTCSNPGLSTVPCCRPRASMGALGSVRDFDTTGRAGSRRRRRRIVVLW